MCSEASLLDPSSKLLAREYYWQSILAKRDPYFRMPLSFGRIVSPSLHRTVNSIRVGNTGRKRMSQALPVQFRNRQVEARICLSLQLSIRCPHIFSGQPHPSRYRPTMQMNSPLLMLCAMFPKSVCVCRRRNRCFFATISVGRHSLISLIALSLAHPEV
jgi:hypothetical protein